MLSITEIKDKAHSLPLRTEEKLLICLAQADGPKKNIGLQRVALQVGFKEVKSWNVSRELSKLAGLAIKTPIGWELTASGKKRVRDLLGVPAKPQIASAAAAHLRAENGKIADADTKAFLEEAISCLENKLLRAAIVLSWVGAVAVLQQFVIAKHLAAFNAEALRRDAKWKTAKTTDDLSRMKEADFLQVLETLSIVGKNVKQELETSLKLRNACGHPNSLKIGESKVAAHVETLVLNVFSKYS